MRRMAAWIAIGAAACGDGALAPDAAIDAPRAPRPDAGTPAVIEAADCGGAPLIPRQGRQLVVSGIANVPFAQLRDLDGDTLPDDRLISNFLSLDGGLALQAGTLAIPIEVFDHDADPDPCVKLALYAGTCASPPCDFTDGAPDDVALAASSIAGGAPVSRLRAMQTDPSGAVAATGRGYLELPIPFRPEAGPGGPLSRFTFPFPITVLYAAGALGPAGLGDLHVAGVAQAFRLGQLPAPRIDALGTGHGETLLDDVFAGIVGQYLELQSVAPLCRLADLDLDGDGRERFCITSSATRVGLCIDGDGTMVYDGDNGLADCSQAMKHGVPRFPDGVPVQVLLSAKPAVFTP